MDVLAITQARTGSTRFPNKVLKTIKGKSLLEIHLKRILKSKKISKLVVATTIKEEDKIISEIASKIGVDSFKGAEHDVLDRYYNTAKKYNPKWVVRLTSDCPVIDGRLIDQVINKAQIDNLDYCSNTLIEAYPDGQDIEVFKFNSLEIAWSEAKSISDREHVTTYIKNNSSYLQGKIFKSNNFSCNKNYNKVRLTVDEKEDFKVIEFLINKLGFDAGWIDYTNEYLKNNYISSLNKNIERNEGFRKSINNDT
jgi:spore coat polysaccharide biosynthesis protein SpsF (cytidylyltransferase family)